MDGPVVTRWRNVVFPSIFEPLVNVGRDARIRIHTRGRRSGEPQPSSTVYDPPLGDPAPWARLPKCAPWASMSAHQARRSSARSACFPSPHPPLERRDRIPVETSNLHKPPDRRGCGENRDAKLCIQLRRPISGISRSPAPFLSRWRKSHMSSAMTEPPGSSSSTARYGPALRAT